MNFRLLLLFLVFLNAQQAQSQKLKYYYYENKSQEFLNKGDTLNAIMYMDSALSYKLPICNYFNGAFLYSLIGKYDIAFKYLKEEAENGMDYAAFCEIIGNQTQYGGTGLDTVLLKRKFPDFATEIDRLAKARQVNYNLDYLHRLTIMYAEDQCIRQVVRKYRDMEDSIGVKPLLALARKIDSTNFYELENLYRNYGLPYKHYVGRKGEFYFLLILGHCMDSDDVIIRKKANELLIQYKKGVISGEFRNEMYANMVDRMYHNINKKNYYGKYFIKDEPFHDFENLDKMRAEIGLQPAISKFKEIMNK